MDGGVELPPWEGLLLVVVLWLLLVLPLLLLLLLLLRGSRTTTSMENVHGIEDGRATRRIFVNRTEEGEEVWER